MAKICVSIQKSYPPHAPSKMLFFRDMPKLTLCTPFLALFLPLFLPFLSGFPLFSLPSFSIFPPNDISWYPPPGGGGGGDIFHYIRLWTIIWLLGRTIGCQKMWLEDNETVCDSDASRALGVLALWSIMSNSLEPDSCKKFSDCLKAPSPAGKIWKNIETAQRIVAASGCLQTQRPFWSILSVSVGPGGSKHTSGCRWDHLGLKSNR